MKKINLIGKRFGRLVVTKETDIKTNQGQIKWLCICDCGNETIVTGLHLRSGDTKSCGCLAVDAIKKANFVHGHTKNNKIPSEYSAWRNIKDRCYNPKYELFHRYGGRGIIVCDRWLTSFDNFLSDMGKRPSAKHSIDRFPNNDGNYEPGNCRWATVEQQAGNRSNNKWIECDGESMIQGDWAKRFNISPHKLRHYLKTMTLGQIKNLIFSGNNIPDKRTSPYCKEYYKNRPKAMLGITGEKNKKSIKVNQINKKTGEFISLFYGINEAGRQLDISPQNIGKVLSGKIKSAGGFKWEYAK